MNDPSSENNGKHILKERAKLLARPILRKSNNADVIEVIPFGLNEEKFAIETRYIREIYPLKNHTLLPCAPDFVYGLTNVRRRILPILDLKVFFSLPNSEEAVKKLLIIENTEMEFALLVDSFSNIKRVSKKEIQTVLPTFTGIRQEFLKGLTVDGTVILDGKKMLASPYLVINTGID